MFFCTKKTIEPVIKRIKAYIHHHMTVEMETELYFVKCNQSSNISIFIL